jgi:hypothetical protein
MICKFFRNNFYRSILFLLIAGIFSCQSEKETSYNLIIDDLANRPVSIFSFDLPEEATENNYHLKNNQGQEIPVQVQKNGKALAVLTANNTGPEFTLELSDEKNEDPVITFKKEENLIRFSRNGKDILSFQTKPALPHAEIDPVFLRAGFIHPVYTPSGKIISDSYAYNHLHHHGIWTAWTKTEFEGRSPDFWNMGDKTGTVEFISLDSSWSGPVTGGFRATLNYIDLTTSEKQQVLEEQWEVIIYNLGDRNKDYSIFDVNIEQKNISKSPLILPEYHYGGLGFRGHESWNGEENTYFLTSEGKDRSDGHATTARWCHIGGKIEGSLAGITIMNHPDNFRAPQHMRIHPTEPFFCYAPSQGGDWAIEPGDIYRAKYRFIVYDGEPDVDFIENIWKDYEQPVKAEVKGRSTN